MWFSYFDLIVFAGVMIFVGIILKEPLMAGDWWSVAIMIGMFIGVPVLQWLAFG